MIRIFVSIFMSLLWFVFYAAVLSIPVQVLWNFVMPEIFGLKTIALDQAAGLIMISQILFKNSSGSSNEKSDK